MRIDVRSIPYRLRVMLTILVVSAVSSLSAAEDDGPSQIKRWHALYLNRAQSLSVTEFRGGDQLELTLFPTSLQAYSNSIRPDHVHGTVHLWTDAGRPLMICSVWSALDQKNRNQRNLCYEFHSLSEFPLTVTRDNKVLWKPKERGIEWIALKDSAAPASTRPLRLAQMRQQMAEIRAEIDTGESELRLLTQPIYRYPDNIKGIVDGAIFSYVIGTDPEIFVLVEARSETTDNELGWYIAPVRFTGSGISLKLGEITVWQRSVWENYDREKIYDFLYGVEHLNAELPAETAKPK